MQNPELTRRHPGRAVYLCAHVVASCVAGLFVIYPAIATGHQMTNLQHATTFSLIPVRVFCMLSVAIGLIAALPVAIAIWFLRRNRARFLLTFTSIGLAFGFVSALVFLKLPTVLHGADTSVAANTDLSVFGAAFAGIAAGWCYAIIVRPRAPRLTSGIRPEGVNSRYTNE